MVQHLGLGQRSGRGQPQDQAAEEQESTNDANPILLQDSLLFIHDYLLVVN
jgi:hypothetical protein